MAAASLMQSPGWQTAGLVMLHFLWVGTAVGVLAAGCRWLVPARSPHRYILALGFFAALAASPGAIYLCLSDQPVAPSNAPLPLPIAPENLNLAERQPPSADDFEEPIGSMSWVEVNFIVACLPWLWLVGAPCTFLVLVSGLIGSERLRRQSFPLEHRDILSRCRRLAESLGILRHVALAVSARLKAPILVGVWKPMILLPPAALTGWTMEQLEMVLLHELAHVRRWDCLVNLWQRTVEALLFFHPMTWWLSGWVRLEREICCDRVVIARTGKPRAYAETLAAMAMRDPALRAGALAMAEHGLITRIRRILNLEDRSMRISTKSLVFGAVFVLTTVVVLRLYARQAPLEPQGVAQKEVVPSKRPVDKNDTATKAASSAPETPSAIGSGAVAQVETKYALSVPGQIEAFEQVNLYTRISGFVKILSVDIGDRVKRGQELVALAAPELDADLRLKEAQVLQAKAAIGQVHGSARAAQAALESVKSQVREAEANFKSAQANDRFRKLQLQRLEEHLAAKSIEQRVVDEARERADSADSARSGAEAKLQGAKANVEESAAKVAKVDADLKVAQAGLRVAEAGAERVQVMRQFAKIRAPFDGVVTRRNVNVGSFAPAAANTPGPPLLSVARTDVLRIVVQVPENKISQISLGTPITVRVDAFPGRVYKAKVSRLAGVLNPASRTLTAEIDLANPEGNLLPGMTGTVVLGRKK